MKHISISTIARGCSGHHTGVRTGVQKDLMRHAIIITTMDIYGQGDFAGAVPGSQPCVEMLKNAAVTL